MLDEINRVLLESVQPQLLLHGGGIRSIGCEDGVYSFELLGQCAGCPAASVTTQELVAAALMGRIPGLRRVELCRPVSQELLAQARAILGHRAR